MTDIIIRRDGHAGRITLNRPQALNALTWDMCTAIDAALDQWRDDPAVALVLIDGHGERAFCAGGDIADMYASGQSVDLDYGRRFWRDEYRMNHKVATYPKPIVSFLHGFTMGGGVGVGCHAQHRIVCENSQISLPECAIGLVPDVGGTHLLARAAGFIGTYLGLTGARMDAGDAIFAGFADLFIPQAEWAAVKEALIATGEVAQIPHHPAPAAALASRQSAIDAAFSGDTLEQIIAASRNLPEAKPLHRNSPLAMACAMILIARARQDGTVAAALAQEFRFTYRAVQKSDFIEGIRAAIIDKDRAPKWKPISDDLVAEMIAPLGKEALTLGQDPSIAAR